MDAIRIPPPAELDGLEDEQFRQVVRAFLHTHYPEHLRNPPKRLHWAENKEWYHILAREGLALPRLAEGAWRHGAEPDQADHPARGIRTPRRAPAPTTTASSCSARC